MNQLVELGKNRDQFKKFNTHVITVFREEKKGEQGLKMIAEKTKTPFTLALDNGKEKTARYSADNMEFSSYVVSPKGEIVEIIKGDLRNRAKAKQLLAAIKSASSPSSESKSSAKKGSESKESRDPKGSTGK